MPLKKQTRTIPLSRGIDAGATDPKLPKIDLLRSQNTLFPRAGGVDKRHGFTKLEGTYTQRFLASHDGKAVLVDDGISAYDSDTSPGGTFASSDDGRLLDVGTEALFAGEAAGLLMSSECVDQDSVTALCYYNGTTHVLYVWHSDSKQQLSVTTENGISGQNYGGRLVGDPGNGFIYWIYADSSRYLKIRAINTSTGAVSASTNLNTSDSFPTVNSYPMDAVLVDSETVMMVYSANSATDYVVGVVVMSAGAYSSAEYDSYNVGVGTIHLHATISKFDTGKALVCYYEEAATREIRAAIWDTSPSGGRISTDLQIYTFTTDTLANMGAVATTLGSKAWVFWCEYDGTAAIESPDLRCAKLDFDGANLTLDAGPYETGGNCSLWGKPFVTSAGDLMVPLHVSTYDNTDDVPGNRAYVIVHQPADGSWTIPVGACFQGTAIEQLRVRNRTGGALNVQEVATDHWMICGKQVYEDEYAKETDSLQREMLHRVDVKVDHLANAGAPTGLHCIEANGVLRVPGSAPFWFDGRVAFGEFFHTPDNLTLSTTGSGSAYATAIGASGGEKVGYVFTYEVYDRFGNRYQSGPSNVVTHTVGTEDSVEIDVACLRILRDLGVYQNVKIVGYRTEPNGSVYRRLLSSTVFELNNDETARSKQFSDDGTDNSTAEQLYTDPVATQANTLANQPIPGYRVSCIHQARKVFAPREFEDRRFVYSQPFANGLGVEHNGLLRVDMTPNGGAITGLYSMDDKLIIFKKGRIYATHGQGKNAQGIGAGYAEPWLVSEHIGCINQKTIAAVPDGVLFESEAGIYKLDRGLGVVPIGQAVRYWSDKETIVGAAVSRKHHVVVFGTSTGTALVFNYLFNRWSTWTGAANVWKLDDIAMVDDKIWLKSTDDKVYVEDDTVWLDNSNSYTMAVETAPIMGSVLGFFRAFNYAILGQSVADHLLKIELQYDHDPVWKDRQYFDALAFAANFDHEEYYEDGLAAASYDSKAYIVKFAGSIQKFTSVRVRIEELPYGQVYLQRYAVLGGGNDFTTSWVDDIDDFETNAKSNNVVDPGVSARIWDIAAGAKNDVWGVGTSTTGGIVGLWRLTASGWAEQSGYPGDGDAWEMRHVWARSASAVFAACALHGRAGPKPGTVIWWNGTVWAALSCGFTEYDYDDIGGSDTDVIVVDNGGGDRVYRYDGSTWTAMSTASGDKFSCVASWDGGGSKHFIGGKNAAGNQAVIWYYDGTSYTSQTLPTVNATILGLLAFSATEAYAFLNNTSVKMLRWDGSTWTQVVTPKDGSASWEPKAWGSAPNDIWLAFDKTTDADYYHFDGDTFYDLANPWGYNGTKEIDGVGSASSRLSLTALSLEVGEKRGIKRLGSGREAT